MVLHWILLVLDTIDDTTPLHAVYIVVYYTQLDDLVRRMKQHSRPRTVVHQHVVATLCVQKQGRSLRMRLVTSVVLVKYN